MKKDKKIVPYLLAMAIGMFGMAYASVPLYRLFCKVTGIGGVTQIAEKSPDKISDRKITVRFNADTAPDLPWIFKPEQKEIILNVGQTALIYYSAENNSDQTIKGTATFNVTPNKAGGYFYKIDCFCFQEQVVKPGEKVLLPVTFFIDPEIENDRNADDIKTITLSYDFFRLNQ